MEKARATTQWWILTIIKPTQAVWVQQTPFSILRTSFLTREGSLKSRMTRSIVQTWKGAPFKLPCSRQSTSDSTLAWSGRAATKKIKKIINQRIGNQLSNQRSHYLISHKERNIKITNQGRATRSLTIILGNRRFRQSRYQSIQARSRIPFWEWSNCQCSCLRLKMLKPRWPWKTFDSISLLSTTLPQVKKSSKITFLCLLQMRTEAGWMTDRPASDSTKRWMFTWMAMTWFWSLHSPAEGLSRWTSSLRNNRTSQRNLGIWLQPEDRAILKQ